MKRQAIIAKIFIVCAIMSAITTIAVSGCPTGTAGTTGTIPPTKAGDVCSADDQCASGLSCIANRCGDTNVGSGCNIDDHCADGLHCFMNACRADLAAGAACKLDTQCASDVKCVAGACGGRAKDRLCTANKDCASGLWCDTVTQTGDGDPNSNRCEPLLTSGSLCSTNPIRITVCASGLSCISIGTRTICSDKSAGSVCAINSTDTPNCNPGLWCDDVATDDDPASLVCEPQLALGAACVLDIQCLSGNCNVGATAATPGKCEAAL